MSQRREWCVALIVSLALAGCRESVEERFKTKVVPVLEARCASSSCHGVPEAGAPEGIDPAVWLTFRIDSAGRIADVPGALASVKAKINSSENPEFSTFLRKTLPVSAGGMHHFQSALFQARDEAGYRALSEFAAMVKDGAEGQSPALDEREQHFADAIYPEAHLPGLRDQQLPRLAHVRRCVLRGAGVARHGGLTPALPAHHLWRGAAKPHPVGGPAALAVADEDPPARSRRHRAQGRQRRLLRAGTGEQHRPDPVDLRQGDPQVDRAGARRRHGSRRRRAARGSTDRLRGRPAGARGALPGATLHAGHRSLPDRSPVLRCAGEPHRRRAREPGGHPRSRRQPRREEHRLLHEDLGDRRAQPLRGGRRRHGAASAHHRCRRGERRDGDRQLRAGVRAQRRPDPHRWSCPGRARLLQLHPRFRALRRGLGAERRPVGHRRRRKAPGAADAHRGAGSDADVLVDRRVQRHRRVHDQAGRRDGLQGRAVPLPRGSQPRVPHSARGAPALRQQRRGAGGVPRQGDARRARDRVPARRGQRVARRPAGRAGAAVRGGDPRRQRSERHPARLPPRADRADAQRLA